MAVEYPARVLERVCGSDAGPMWEMYEPVSMGPGGHPQTLSARWERNDVRRGLPYGRSLLPTDMDSLSQPAVPDLSRLRWGPSGMGG